MYLDAEERKAALAAENRVSDGMMFKLDFDPRIIGSRRLPDGTIKRGLEIRSVTYPSMSFTVLECTQRGYVSGRYTSTNGR